MHIYFPERRVPSLKSVPECATAYTFSYYWKMEVLGSFQTFEIKRKKKMPNFSHIFFLIF